VAAAAAAACRHYRKLRKKRGTDQDPPTPDIKKKMGKRAWDGVVSGLQGGLQEGIGAYPGLMAGWSVDAVYRS
jgi:hypothetical protein